MKISNWLLKFCFKICGLQKNLLIAFYVLTTVEDSNSILMFLAKGAYRIQIISMALHFFSQYALQLLKFSVSVCLNSFQHKIY